MLSDQLLARFQIVGVVLHLMVVLGGLFVGTLARWVEFTAHVEVGVPMQIGIRTVVGIPTILLALAVSKRNGYNSARTAAGVLLTWLAFLLPETVSAWAFLGSGPALVIAGIACAAKVYVLVVVGRLIATEWPILRAR